MRDGELIPIYSSSDMAWVSREVALHKLFHLLDLLGVHKNKSSIFTHGHIYIP